MVLEGRYWLQDIPEYAGLGLLGKTALLAGPAISEVCVRDTTKMGVSMR